MDWEQVADRYCEIEDSRFQTVFPITINILKQLNCQMLLDFGAGDGRFVEEWLTQNPHAKAVAYDPAMEMVHRAQNRLQRFGNRARVVQDLTEVNELFDAVTFHAVWMCLPTEHDCLNCLRSVHRLLKHDGKFIASVTHPCFRDRQFSTFRTSFDMANYGSKGISFKVTIFDGNKSLTFTDYHWNLSEMSRQLKISGFFIDEIIEVPDIEWKDNPYYAWMIIIAGKRTASSELPAKEPLHTTLNLPQGRPPSRIPLRGFLGMLARALGRREPQREALPGGFGESGGLAGFLRLRRRRPVQEDAWELYPTKRPMM